MNFLKNIPFAITSKNRKIGINLTKVVKILYTENHKTLIKEIKGDKWKDILCPGLEELKLLKYPYFPKRSRDMINSWFVRLSILLSLLHN